MRRKRRTKYTWFTPQGSVGPTADLDDTTNGIELVTGLPLNGASAVSVTPLLMDQPSDDLNVGQPMGFYENNAYFIKRIVGKLFVSISQTASSSTARAALVGAGLFVARAADADTATGANFPIGGTSATDVLREYSPLRVENMHEPWIWRRTWILAQQGFTGADDTGVKGFPITNASYGSIQDGPHVDAKTARRVNNDERLFWIMAVRSYPLNQVFDTATAVRAYFDYRVLGAMRKQRNRGVF